ncbi:MAG: restriction endonuclease [Candidatus Methanomethyliales bacterium]|nr:restriction endonuclease [Candidatus Methanomethylicales archaeon]
MEEILRRAGWKDFEELTSDIMREAGFLTFRNFRFSSRRKRYEIDVIALENPRIILVDCKRWDLRPGKSSALRASASKHLRRSLEFLGKIQEFRSLNISNWKRVILIPIIVTLYDEGIVEYERVLIVPIFKMTSFLEEARDGIFDQITAQISNLESLVRVE